MSTTPVPDHSPGHELVVVANRLPVDSRTLPDGATEWVTSPGGLVTAMESVMRTVDSGAWVGWAGAPGEAPDPFEADGMSLYPVRLEQEDVERYYSLVDIAPFPRLPLPVCEMVSPLKPFEALAMGKAIVASDVAALAEIVQPDVTGLLHRKGDVDDLTAKLTELVERPELRQQLAADGLRWVRENRQWPDMARSVSTIYEQLGASRPSGE